MVAQAWRWVDDEGCCRWLLVAGGRQADGVAGYPRVANREIGEAAGRLGAGLVVVVPGHPNEVRHDA